jgi:hypothetical protein
MYVIMMVYFLVIIIFQKFLVKALLGHIIDIQSYYKL